MFFFIYQKFYYPCHSRGQLNDRVFAHSNHLIPFTRPKKPVVFASTALNIVQGEVQQKVSNDYKICSFKRLSNSRLSLTGRMLEKSKTYYQ